MQPTNGLYLRDYNRHFVPYEVSVGIALSAADCIHGDLYGPAIDLSAEHSQFGQQIDHPGLVPSLEGFLGATAIAPAVCISKKTQLNGYKKLRPLDQQPIHVSTVVIPVRLEPLRRFAFSTPCL